MTKKRKGEEAMSGKLEACAECSKLCQLVHRRNGDSSPLVNSFFKVMFGASYNEVLFLPPKFARTVPDLIGQEAQLEDSSGKQWTVTVSNVDDSLAFYEGWNAFSEDHRVMLGDILVFHYITGCHFFVQVYGRSGCQKYLRVEGNGNSKKKTRTEGNFGTKDGPCYMNDSGFGLNGSMGSGSFDGSSQHRPPNTSKTPDSENEFGRFHSVSETRQFEEPLCIIDRDTSYIQEEHRSSLYDLSMFEIQSGQKYSNRGSTILKFPTEAEMVDKDPINHSVDVSETSIIKPAEKGKENMGMLKEEAICQHAEKPSSVHPTEGDTSTQQVYTMLNSPTKVGMLGDDRVRFSRHVLETFVAKAAESRKKTLPTPKETTCQNAEGRSSTHLTETIRVTKKEPADAGAVQNWERTLHSTKKEPADTGAVPNWERTLHGNEKKGLKDDSNIFSLASKQHDVIFQPVKTEPTDFDDNPLPDISDTSYEVVIGSEKYLELPTSFPPITVRKTRCDRKVVFLRGSDSRLWPVLYIHKYGLKILSCGWEPFRKANMIQPGDEYFVESEKHCMDSIYRFRKVSK